MTVLDSTPRDQYTATSGQTVFPYTFEIAAAGDIKVLQNGTLINQGAGAGEYAVSGVGVDTGGNVTLVTGATTGDVLTIYRDMALERLTAYANAGDFLAADVNNDFDRLWLALQQNGGDLDGRVLIAPNTDPTSINMTIPDKAARSGKLLQFNATTGNPEVVSANSIVGSGAFNVYNFAGDGATVAFTLGAAPGVENNTQVYIDGVYQQKNTYTVSGTTLTFSAAPPNLSTIEVMVVTAQPINTANAASVSFTQAGSTDTRTVQAKLEESVSVLDFGFDGTGGTDNTAKFNTMLAALSGSKSVTVRFPAGQYHFASKPNNISSSVSFVGDGISNTRLFRDFAAGANSEGVFNFVGGANGSSVSQMSIESNGAPGGATGCLISLIASASDAPDYCHFSDLYLTSNNTDVFKIYIDGSLRTGSPSGVRDTFISNCSIFGGSLGGVYAKSVVGFHMTSCDTFPAGGVSGKIVITGITGNKSFYVNIDGATLNGLALDELNFGNFNAAVYTANITNASTADTIIVQGSLGATVTVQNFWLNSIFLSNTGTPNNFLVGGKARGNILQVTDGVTAPATEVGYSSIYVDTADGDLKIKFGDGTVKTIVTDT